MLLVVFFNLIKQIRSLKWGGENSEKECAFLILKITLIGLFWHLHYHDDITTFQATSVLKRFVMCDAPQTMHTVAATAPFSGLIMEPQGRDINDEFFSLFVVYNAAADIGWWWCFILDFKYFSIKSNLKLLKKHTEFGFRCPWKNTHLKQKDWINFSLHPTFLDKSAFFHI